MRPALATVWGRAALRNAVLGVVGHEAAQRFLLSGATLGTSMFHEGPRSTPPTGVSMSSRGFSADVLYSSRQKQIKPCCAFPSAQSLLLCIALRKLIGVDRYAAACMQLELIMRRRASIGTWLSG